MKQLYDVGGLGELSFMQLFHAFLSTEEALGEYFKETWVRVNPNDSVSFVSDITNGDNE